MTSKNIFTLQVRKLLQQIFDRVTAGKVFENSLYRIPQPSYARLAVAYFRIHSDSRK